MNMFINHFIQGCIELRSCLILSNQTCNFNAMKEYLILVFHNFIQGHFIWLNMYLKFAVHVLYIKSWTREFDLPNMCQCQTGKFAKCARKGARLKKNAHLHTCCFAPKSCCSTTLEIHSNITLFLFVLHAHPTLPEQKYAHLNFHSWTWNLRCARKIFRAHDKVSSLVSVFL